MGVLGRIIGTAGVAVGGIIAAKSLLGNREEKIGELDVEFEENKHIYEKKRKLLVQRINSGDRRAVDKLEELDHDFKIQKMEYEAERKKLMPKNSKAEEDLKKMELAHKNTMEEMEAEHAMTMEKMAFQSQNRSNVISNDSSEAGNKECGNCHSRIPQSAKFCPECGAEITIRKKFCTNCGAQADAESKFCIACGQKLC